MEDSVYKILLSSKADWSEVSESERIDGTSIFVDLAKQFWRDKFGDQESIPDLSQLTIQEVMDWVQASESIEQRRARKAFVFAFMYTAGPEQLFSRVEDKNGDVRIAGHPIPKASFLEKKCKLIGLKRFGAQYLALYKLPESERDKGPLDMYWILDEFYIVEPLKYSGLKKEEFRLRK